MRKEPEATQIELEMTAGLSRTFAGLGRAGAASALACLLATVTTGCAGDASDLENESRASASLDANLWRPWGDPPPNPVNPMIPPGAPTALDSNPTICSNEAGFSNIFVRDSNKHFRGRTMALLDGDGTGDWSTSIGTLQFSSSPACAMFVLPYSMNGNLLLAGKATDNKIYVQQLTADIDSSGPSDPAMPPVQTSWSALSQTTYPNSSNGFPAVASTGNQLLVTFRNNNTIIAHSHGLPYSLFGWSGPQTAPSLQLPPGVNLTGVPAITYVGGTTNAFVVVVKSTTSRVIWWIKYNGTAWVGSWTRAVLPHTLTSDPALEWTNLTSSSPPYTALTLYFRDETNQVVQTSVTGPTQFANGSYQYIPAPSGTTILGTPSVVFGGGLESGIRTLVVQGYRADTPQSLKSSWYLVTEDLCGGGTCPATTP